jgi:biotin carboxyl carrier protein
MKINVKIQNQIFEVEVGDINARPIMATIDGETFEVWPEQTAAPTAAPEAQVPAPAAAPVAAPVAAPPAAPAAKAAVSQTGAKAVNAPIPGVIISVSVKPGQAVSTGQELCILEAMKMKNAIRASRAGTISEIHVASGDHVVHGQTLMEFTD